METRISKQLIDDIIAGKYTKRQIQILLAKQMYGDDIETVHKVTKISKSTLYSINKHTDIKLKLKKDLKQDNSKTKQESNKTTPNIKLDEKPNIIINQLKDDKLKQEFHNILIYIYNYSYISYKKYNCSKTYNIYNNNINNIYNNNNINNNNYITDKNNNCNIEKYINTLGKVSSVAFKKLSQSTMFTDLSAFEKSILGYYLSYMIALGLKPLVVNYKELIENIKKISDFSSFAKWNDFKTKNMIVKQINKHFEQGKYVSIIHLRNFIDRATLKDRQARRGEIKALYNKVLENFERRAEEVRRIMYGNTIQS